jgi:hypothetical protein
MLREPFLYVFLSLITSVDLGIAEVVPKRTTLFVLLGGVLTDQVIFGSLIRSLFFPTILLDRAEGQKKYPAIVIIKQSMNNRHCFFLVLTK